MMNICLLKPACQSSTSEFSLHDDPEQDAKGGNDGRFDVEYGFHTGLERDPWWQVDLEKIYDIKKIRIFNRRNRQERLNRFSILGSLDGINFTIMYSKTGDECFGDDEATCFDLEFHDILQAQYVRIRLDGLNVLHFKEIEIYGQLASPPASTLSEKALDTDCKFVFSVLYNESAEFLPALIRNFLAFTEENCIMIVNVSNPQLVEMFSSHAYPRVFVHLGQFPRRKFGHTLLLGHLENVKYAEKYVPDYSFFCSLASNSLFVRCFNYVEAIRALRMGNKIPIDADVEFDYPMRIDKLPDHWWWKRLKNEPKAVAFIAQSLGLRYLVQNQIEGFLSSRANWKVLLEKEYTIEQLGLLLSQENLLPLEEILPASIIQSFGDSLHTNICHVFWSRFRTNTKLGIATIDDVLMVDIRFPRHVCSFKWFERDIKSFLTSVVTDKRRIKILNVIRDAFCCRCELNVDETLSLFTEFAQEICKEKCQKYTVRE